jgi:hypothetical protein
MSLCSFWKRVKRNLKNGISKCFLIVLVIASVAKQSPKFSIDTEAGNCAYYNSFFLGGIASFLAMTGNTGLVRFFLIKPNQIPDNYSKFEKSKINNQKYTSWKKIKTRKKKPSWKMQKAF